MSRVWRSNDQIVSQAPGVANAVILSRPATPRLAMRLAVFDLDNTLLAGDSDYLWGEFLVEEGLVDGAGYARDNQRYYQAYLDGTLDIAAFCAFSLAPVSQHGADKL